MDEKLDYRDTLSDSQINNTIIIEGESVSMKESYDDFDSYKKFIESIYEERFYIDPVELTTPSINVYNHIIKEEMSKDDPDMNKVAVYIYKLGFLLVRFIKRSPSNTCSVCANNILLIVLDRMSKVEIDSYFKYITSIIRYRFYDLLSSEFVFKNVSSRLDIEYSDTDYEDASEFTTFEDRVIVRELIDDVNNILMSKFDKYIRYHPKSREYLKIKRDFIINFYSMLYNDNIKVKLLWTTEKDYLIFLIGLIKIEVIKYLKSINYIINDDSFIKS